MGKKKIPGAAWSLSDVAAASGRSAGNVTVTARQVLPSRLLETRHGRGAAVQLPEPVAQALADALRFGTLNPQMVEAIEKDPEAVLAAAAGLVELVRLRAGVAQDEAA